MYLNVAISIFACLLVYAKAETCPPEIQTRPCECFTEYDGTLECNNLTDASIFEGITRRTGDITFKKLRVFDSEIESLPPDTLMKKQFNSIEIYNSKLLSLFDGVDESNNIVALDLLNVEFLRRFPWSQLKPLKNLRVFVVKRGFIPELGDDFKNNVNKELAFLSLSNTTTRWISDEIFSDYKKLRQIHIENCGLSYVKRNFFPIPAENLSDLKLGGNGIKVLPDDIFKEMPKLQFVSLERNKLTTLSEAIFTSMDHQLGSLDLKKNPINCDCSLKWIVTLQKMRYGLTGNCHSGPEELIGKELEALKLEDFASCH